jgi:hypothetical protein
LKRFLNPLKPQKGNTEKSRPIVFAFFLHFYWQDVAAFAKLQGNNSFSFLRHFRALRLKIF